MPYDPETGEFIDDQNATGGEPQRSNQDWAKLRQAEKAARDAEAKAAETARVNAFLRAGIDPEDKKAGYFFRGYDGELTPEAIRAAALEAGFTEAAPGAPAATPSPTADGTQAQPTPEQVKAAELAAQGRIDAAGTGASPAPVDPSNLIEEAFRSGGEGALLDAMAAQGIPIAYEGIVQQ